MLELQRQRQHAWMTFHCWGVGMSVSVKAFGGDHSVQWTRQHSDADKIRVVMAATVGGDVAVVLNQRGLIV